VKAARQSKNYLTITKSETIMNMGAQSIDVSERMLWLIVAVWSMVTLISIFAPQVVSFNLARYINIGLMTGFTLLHGSRRYGWRGIVIYFLVAVVITNIFENLSIATGFPFGQYQHTASMGPKLFYVPLIIGPIFAVAGYLGWVLAGILLGDVFTRPRDNMLLAKPLIASFITTSWDFCVDPIGGTINRDWIWAEGGGYFGVSWTNYFGWMLTLWVIYQVFALYLARRGERPAAVDREVYWLQPLVFWMLIALQFPLVFVLAADSNVTVSDPAGAAWQVADLLETMALVSFFTMLFVAVLGFFLVRQVYRRD
jgi:putative membrane protein